MINSTAYHTWNRQIQELRPGHCITLIRSVVWLIAGIYKNGSVELSRESGKVPFPPTWLSISRRLNRLLNILTTQGRIVKLSIDLIKRLLYNLFMDIFTALAEPTRRTIMEMLARNGQLSATEISNQFPVSPQAISQHLKVLREAKLVLVEKRAQQRMYQINPEAMLELEGWANQLRQLWNQRFDALEMVLEKEKKRLKGEVE